MITKFLLYVSTVILITEYIHHIHKALTIFSQFQIYRQPLPSTQHQFHLYTDNYFCNILLFHYLYNTLGNNYIPSPLKHFDETQFKDLPWNHLAAITTSDPHIQTPLWKYNNMVKLLISTHSAECTVERMRRKPRNALPPAMLLVLHSS